MLDKYTSVVLCPSSNQDKDEDFSHAVQSLHSVYIPDHGEIICVRSPDDQCLISHPQAESPHELQEPVDLSADRLVVELLIQKTYKRQGRRDQVSSKGIGAETKGGSVGLSAGVGGVMVSIIPEGSSRPLPHQRSEVELKWSSPAI
ncbi:hypothetical protein F2Q69_00056103 [Brassica cretica]|uniref:Uncharacterized protein n=1 Tax=Brassica cretica TaxID=69181 RepID=A0A8S9N9E2_BRACR|nr:hypothetical protein F2Q69_00056103 [Brassica cretica]